MCKPQKIFWKREKTVKFKKIAITGGAGYVGSALVPYLIDRGYEVTVLDLFLYGDDVLKGISCPSLLNKVKLDIRDEKKLTEVIQDQDALIHLACISNDPSFDLDPHLGKSINFDAFNGLLRAVRRSQIRRFIYASTSSVYGVKKETDVHEEGACAPLTDYSRYKLLCEEALKKEGLGDCEYVILRPATVCGYAPRLRLDLVVNILTINALVKNKITLFGRDQLRPNIHIQDIVEVYRILLETDGDKIHRETFNAGYQNRSLAEIAEIIRETLGNSVEIEFKPTNDPRSYHITSEKIKRVLAFQPRHTIEEAVQGLSGAYNKGWISDPLNNPFYYNIKMMKELHLQ